MSRGCGSNQVIVLRGCCPSDSPTPTDIELANVNLSGVGVLDSWDGTNGNFRGVASANSMLTVTLDNVNHNALLTVVPAAIQAQFTIATEIVPGIAELATQAEVTAGTSDTTIVTPLKLATRQATTTLSGLIEIATQPEVAAGLSTTLAVVPSTLASLNFLSLADSTVTTMASGALSTVNLGSGSLLQFVSDNTGQIIFNQTLLAFSSGTVDFNNTQLSISGTPVSGSSVMITDTGGFIAEKALDQFISTANTNSGWTAFANASVLKTCDVNTVTLPQLASIVNTLLTTLKAVQIPTT